MKFIVLLMFLLFICFNLSYSMKPYTSIFSFGDSLADTGNFHITGAVAFIMADLPPYGVSFFKKPTGRYSDGRLVVDFIAQALCLPLLPPYLELKQNRNFRQGVNFAVSGATALDPSFFIKEGIGGALWTNYSLSTQVEWFEKLMPSLCHTAQECSEYFSKSLFLMGEIGGNDYNFPLLYGRIPLQEVYTKYVPKVVRAITKATQKLIDLGAVNLIVPGNLPVGCSPIYLTLLGANFNYTDYDAKTGCLKNLNKFSKYHNKLLIQALKQLQLKNPQAKIVYANYYDAVFQINSTPEKFGFIHEVLRTCCGSGGDPYNFDIRALCGQQGSSVCKNPSSYLNWDGIHLTEAAYRHIADGLLHGPYANPPIIH